MTDVGSQQPPPGQQENPWLPAGMIPLAFEEFDGIDTQPSRPGVDDKKMAWCDGFIPLGNRNLRTMYGVGPAIYTNTGQIVWYDFANINATPIAVVLLKNGSLQQVNTSTNAVTQMAGPGTISNPNVGQIAITQWGNKYVIIVSSQTNGYFIWDGTTFYSPGQSAPGGGTVPTGISGTAIETFTSRVWVSNGAVITFSAPSSFVDFSTNNGGGSFTSNDSFLRVAFSNLRQTNGFLYLIADSSINYISGVQSTGSGPVTTTFTNQNADPEIGTPWAATVDVFSRNILFANAFGAHVSYGGAVTKISQPLDGVYNTVPNFGGFTPSAGKAIVFGRKIWALLLPVIDPTTGQQVNKLFCYYADQRGSLWWSTPQEVTLIYIQHQEINSVLTAFGTDGNAIYPLFQQPSVTLPKKVQTKLWDRPSYLMTKTADRLFGLAQYYSLLSPSITVSVDNENGSSSQTYNFGPNLVIVINNFGAQVPVINNSNQPVSIVGSSGGIAIFPPQEIGQNGVLLGMTISTNAADMALVSMTIGAGIWQYRG